MLLTNSDHSNSRANSEESVNYILVIQCFLEMDREKDEEWMYERRRQI